MAKDNRDGRAERLKRDKARIRERYSPIPFLNWFRRDPAPEKLAGVELEKNDVLAMILAALSLVLPWALGLAGAMALLAFLVRLWLGG